MNTWASVCLFCCLPHFLESFFPCLLMLSPGCVRGEHPPPSPHTSPLQLPNERGTKDVCLLAPWAQLTAQQCFGNLCSATGAGEGRELGEGVNTLVLVSWWLGGIPEFLSAAVRSNRKGSSHHIRTMKPLELRPFSARCSKMGCPLPATRICL